MKILVHIHTLHEMGFVSFLTGPLPVLTFQTVFKKENTAVSPF